VNGNAWIVSHTDCVVSERATGGPATTRGKYAAFVRSTLFILALASPTWAQDLSAVEQQVERLHAQLREVTEKQSQLQERARRLDEDLRPENVERSVAPVGTTDARALRDQRRQQLERQKAAVDEQLSSLAASRTRLEAAISTAETEAVRLRAAALGTTTKPVGVAPVATPSAPAVVPVVKKRPAASRKSRPRKRGRTRRRS
jgi:prefoldin subunit 5